MTINEIFSTIRDWAVGKFQPKGEYASSGDIPTKVSELENDEGYISSVPDNYVTNAELDAKGYLTDEIDPTVSEWAKQPTKPAYNKAEVGLGNVNNTSDVNKPVSTAQQAAIGAAYQQATAYADQIVNALVNGAPGTLDTLGEIAEAMKNNQDVVEALEQAIGTKASEADFAGHINNTTIHTTASEKTAWNNKMEKTGDASNTTIAFTSGDASNPTGWVNIALMTTGEKLSSFAQKCSLGLKNLRYLKKIIGSTDLSGLGDGTITGAIAALNTDLTSKLRNLSLLADTREDGAASKALNIVSSHAAYRSTTYFVTTTRANRIIHVLVIQGYTSNTTMTGIDLGVVRLYEDADYLISATTAIAEGSTVRVKIAMATADKSYRSFIIPLGTGATNGTASYTASWATS